MRSFITCMLARYNWMTKTRRMRWACSMHGKRGNASYRVLVEKPEGKKPPGKPRHR
jgi:hypothetical protein